MSTNESKTPYADEVAPEPDWMNDANTADSIIRYELVKAQQAFVLNRESMHKWFQFEPGDTTPEGVQARTKYLMHMYQWMAGAHIADLLIEIQKAVPEKANEIARGFYDRCLDGGLHHELVWEWLADRGIDADKITTEMEAIV